MSMWLRQSTASQEILLGRFVDSTDGNTEETALTIANTDIKLHKHGATTLASKNSGGATHIANGNYYAVLDATDTDTLGNLEVHVHVAGALAVKREYLVVPAMIFDSIVLGTDRLDTNVTHVADTAQTAGDLKASITAILTTAMTESYNTDGAAPTPAQALFLILQMLTEKSISSTTLTVKKLDGSTTAATFTLDSSTAPTSITRAS
mgnify:CR=1 FL=1